MFNIIFNIFFDNIEIDIDEGKILVISTPKQLAYFIEKYERSVSYSDFLKEVNWDVEP